MHFRTEAGGLLQIREPLHQGQGEEHDEGVVDRASSSVAAGSLGAQTIDDSLMMPRNNFCTGFMYQHDSWTATVGRLAERGNENIGTITTRT